MTVSISRCLDGMTVADLVCILFLLIAFLLFLIQLARSQAEVASE